MLNFKALAFTVKKLLARIKFQTELQSYRIIEGQIDRQDKNNIPPDL